MPSAASTTKATLSASVSRCPAGNFAAVFVVAADVPGGLVRPDPHPFRRVSVAVHPHRPGRVIGPAVRPAVLRPGRAHVDDTLPYDEPWGWMHPTRHAYGALLLEQGKIELAEAVYAADLGLDATLGRACQHPGNVWSLHGYHECLTRLGKNDAARVIAQQLKLAAARADVPIRASCACRMSVA